MASGNWFETRRKAYGMRTKKITTSSTLTTYTTRAGGASDNFIEDAVIEVTTTSGNSLTITVSDGTYSGQTLLVIFTVEGNNEGVTITPDTGAATNLTADRGYSLLMWVAVRGWTEISADADEA
ncbi:MAG: hypothetical protein E3J87_09575 [Candidatus Cloacimonadota bacterium]|nr:MAG: hypothetical protein E3J87_09575 [Candidatus Cloacimonadota bacterium]